MDKDATAKIQLQCLCEMFAGRVDEDVIYIVFTENDKHIEQTIEQLLVISGDALPANFPLSSSMTSTAHANRYRPSNVLSSVPSRTPSPDELYPDDLAIQELSRASREGRLYVPHQADALSESDRSSSTESRTKDVELESKASSDSPPESLQEFKKVKNKHRFKKRSSVAKPGIQSAGTSKDVTDQGSDLNDDIDYDDDWMESSSNDVELCINTIYQDLDELLSDRNECYQKACYYNVRKMYSVSSYYADQATKITTRMTKRSNALVDLLIRKCEHSNSIDLHGLNPTQATLVVTRLLKLKQDNLLIDKQGEVCVDIITGWGKHSILGGRIKPCIMSLLGTKNIVYQQINRGALRVTIKRTSKPQPRSRNYTPSPPTLIDS